MYKSFLYTNILQVFQIKISIEGTSEAYLIAIVRVVKCMSSSILHYEFSDLYEHLILGVG